MSEGEVVAQQHDIDASIPTSEPPAPTNGVDDPSTTNGVHSELPFEPNGNSETKEEAEKSGVEQNENGVQVPGRKRKFESISRSGHSSRAPSPPWKLPAYEGPSAVIVDGRRKSTRTSVPAPDEELAPAPRRTRAVSASKPRPSYTPLRNGKMPKAKALSQSPRDKKQPSLGKTSGQAQFKKPGRPVKKPQDIPLQKSPSRPRSSSKVAGRSDRNASFTTPPKSNPRRSSRFTEDTTPTHGRETSNTNGWHEDTSSNVPTPSRFQRLKLFVRDPTQPRMLPLPRTHPGHYPPPKKFESFEDWLRHDDPLEGENEVRLTEDQIRKEAKVRLRLARAIEPGGLLSEDKFPSYRDQEWEEPQPRYGHWSHVAAHARNFQRLLSREATAHKRLAKQVALACQTAIITDDKWVSLREAKSAEEIYKEEEGYQKKRYAQVVKDVASRWQLARQEVNQKKLAEWEAQQEALGKKALDDMLDQSTKLLYQHRVQSESELQSEDQSSVGLYGTDLDTAADHTGTETGGESGSEEEESELDDENMSESSDDEEEEDINDAQDEDAKLSPEALQKKYAALLEQNPIEISSESSSEEETSEPETEGQENGNSRFYSTDRESDVDSANENGPRKKLKFDGHNTPGSVPSPEHPAEGAEDTSPNDTDKPPPVLDEVDDILLDHSSDESTDMDDDLGSSNSSGSGTDGDDEGAEGDGESEDEDEDGLMGFFGKSTRAAIKNDVASTPEAVEEVVESSLVNGEDESVMQLNDEDATLDNVPTEELSHKSKTNGVGDSHARSRPDSVAGSPSRASTPGTPQTPKTLMKTEVPSLLLRGSLREYQHDGLDWLANLYAGQRNGILADEMGLGKTIQTISLLAHLAVRHEVWGPHLVVVPSSVILNWEIEFKKWLPGFKILTYYGPQDVRRKLREGWLNNDKWNVCITSYQLILKDQQAFKRRSWHYLILDEAHNIKNFQSQRWQVLLTFKTHSRLLLTGTPLQNNLQELWSLLYFLMPGGLNNNEGFADLENFLNSMKRPADQILDQGMQKLDAEAQARVNKLHEVLRPFLLRRLKSEVEKQMPLKYEHVVYCRLSKRQRQLYDEFMGRAETKRTLASGNYMSIIHCLMNLRKVCNHPDLFETRQIVTSFAMPKSAVAGYEIKETLVRRRLLASDTIDLEHCGLRLVAYERHGRLHQLRRDHIKAFEPFDDLIARQTRRLKPSSNSSLSTMQGALSHVADKAEQAVLDQLKNCRSHASHSNEQWPTYGTDFVRFLTMPDRFRAQRPNLKKQRDYSMGEWYLDNSSLIPKLMPTIDEVALRSEILVRKFGCITPAVVAEDVAPLALTPKGMEVVRQAQELAPNDPFHEARIRLSIAFPDKRLLQYDCGKLQRLDKLLRQLQAGGHRCLIFTQMTKVLDILEQFLNIHGHRYLRLDGSTKIEQRQILTDRFNNDNRILAFILSSRSGGLGINLTGADTVIFYDLDWNPAMDAQCQDRCHRIGQTRDVHIYRFVSEYTIEANILRKSNQKRLLDDVIIQKGDFTTDSFNRVTYRDAFDDPVELGGEDAEASAAMDRVLGEVTGLGQVLESAEDKEDTAAAKAAQKEMIHIDAEDFNESTEVSNTPRGTSVPQTPMAELAEKAREMEGSEAENVDEYMVKFVEENEMAGVKVVPKHVLQARRARKKGKDWQRRR